MFNKTYMYIYKIARLQYTVTTIYSILFNVSAMLFMYMYVTVMLMYLSMSICY